jgi:hypothetical protein
MAEAKAVVDAEDAEEDDDSGEDAACRTCRRITCLGASRPYS